MELGNVTGAIPIHGFMSRTDQWQVVEAKADGKSAWVTSRLDVYKQPMWMKQWPFAHTIEMTYRLQDGVLEVQTKITNMAPSRCRSRSASIRTISSPIRRARNGRSRCRRDALAAATTRRFRPAKPNRPTSSFPAARARSRTTTWTTCSAISMRDAQGRATVTLKGRKQQLDIMLGPELQIAGDVFAESAEHRARQPDSAAEPERAAAAAAAQPRGAGRAGGAARPNPLATPNFICFEPMAGITNALNLAHKGVYKELQYIQPGGTWQESFWIKPSGF